VAVAAAAVVAVERRSTMKIKTKIRGGSLASTGGGRGCA
jgi:hypothetical protein